MADPPIRYVHNDGVNIAYTVFGEGLNDLVFVPARAGLHCGECERVGNHLQGIAVITAARVAALSDPGEVLVSGTVKDLVAGAEFTFDGRGVHALKGVPGEWQLFGVTG